MFIKPVGKMIVSIPEARQDVVTESGIFLPQTHYTPTVKVLVKEIGPDVTVVQKGSLAVITLGKGDMV